MTPSWYDVLDVSPTASADEIRGAWRSAIAELEPGSRRFQTLNQAAEVLLDEQRRAAYDAELAPSVVETPTEAATHDDQTPWAAVPAAPPATGRGLTVPTWLIAALGVLAVACLAAAVWVWQAGDDSAIEDSASSAQSAAEQAIVPLLSYDYETLDEDQARTQTYLTAGYRVKYDQLFAVIKDNAPEVQPKVEADAFASAIVRASEDRVDVLVFVDQLTLNKGMAEPVNYRNQATVTMQKVGDDWLIDNLVTSPATQ